MLRRKNFIAALGWYGVSLVLLAACASDRPLNHRDASKRELASMPEGQRTHIIGSAMLSGNEQEDGKSYYLYGAEHIKLDNYHFDIPVVYNDKVKKWIDFFLNRGRDYFERYSARAGRYAPIMGHILAEHGLPRDLIFLAMAESGFQTKAKSWARAVGPWQFMPYTGKKFGLRIDWYIDERRDPIKATVAASQYLTKLYNDFGSWELAAAAYNAGEGKIGRAIERYKAENFWHLLNGRYLKAETKNYVPKIMALAIIGKNLKSFGLADIDFHEPLDFDEIKVPAMTDLFEVAKLLDIDFEELERLNPEILRWFTPPDMAEYTLRIPVGKKNLWRNCCEGQKFLAKDFQTYTVASQKSNNTLKSISQKFKIKGQVLEDFNNFAFAQKLPVGTVVTLPFKVGQSRRENMYADLYERPRKEILIRQTYRGRIRLAAKKGKKIVSPVEYYTVQKGDTLWTVAQKTGVSLDTLIVSNMKIIKNRMIRAGDRLIIR